MKPLARQNAIGSLLASLLIGSLTLNAADSPQPPTNVARGARVTAFSSMEQSGWQAAAATDGVKGGLGWSSKAFAAFPDHSLYPEWVAVDLGRHYRVERVDLCPRGDAANAGLAFPRDFTIAVCAEGEPWTTVLDRKDHPQPKGAEVQSFAVAPQVARFVRVQATRLRPDASGKHYFQLSELEVFGTPAEVPAPVAAPPLAAQPAAVANLRCEHRVNPLGVDRPRPHLSWTMEGRARGQRQTAYRVLVAASPAELEAHQGSLWDSGKVASDNALGIEYSGQPLGSGKRYYWKVMLWDKDGAGTPWSPPAEFVMGKLNAEDWKGQWIGASEDPKHQAVYLRKEIEVARPVKRATAFFCGLGYGELYVDGAKVSDWVLSPGNTCYHIRTPYLVFDVTRHLAQPGKKALGVILSDGWYGLEKDPWCHRFETLPYVDKPKLRLDIEVEYADGTSATFCSDAAWKWNCGEITYSWIGVEHIDLRRANTGWDKPGYADGEWKPVAAVKGPAGKLVVQKEPPTRILETLKPQMLHQDAKTGAWIYDFGREFQGWPRLRAAGPAGTVITLVSHPTSKFTAAGSHFTLAGKGVEEYAPRFHYNAISRVEVRGLAKPPALDDLTGCLVNADLADAGRLRCSDDTVNWLDESVRRTQMNYVTGYPNDPTREKKGWTQDIETMLESSAYLLDSQTLYERWFWDLNDGQKPDGNCPNVTPGPFYDAYNSPWWGGCMVWGPWHGYLFYGDQRVLADHYSAMKKYVDFLAKSAKDGLQDWGLKDWLAIKDTPRPQVNTPAHYLFARMVSESARILGHADDAQRYAAMAEGVRKTFNTQYLTAATGVYANPTQGALALALGTGLVPAERRQANEQALLAAIAASKNFLTTGFVSTPYLLDVLAELDPQVGHTMTMQRPAPSWCAMTVGTDHDVQKEKWDGGQALMPSLGGSIAKWHFRALAGLWPDESGPGFKKFIVRPNPVGDLHWVQCRYDSVRGRIESKWQRRGRQFTIEVVIPANTTATVFVPAERADAVTESGKPLAQAEGVRLLRTEPGRIVLACEAGVYRFTAALPGTKGAGEQ